VRIDLAIAHTRQFFESLHVSTRLSGYGIFREAIPALLVQLERHGLTALGEHENFNLADAQRVFELAA
jgi:NADP-dependent alcohol dehydrogenase